jgi:DNA-binding transcriptional MerR regulator
VSEPLYIGTLARRSGRTVHTIRWYEAQGLLPGVVRERGGRRVYKPEHVDHLVFLNWLRRTGMSIAAMRALTALSMQGWRTLAERKELLRTHRERVESEIGQLQVALDLIDAKVAYYAEWEAKKKRPPWLHAVPNQERNNAATKRGTKRGSMLHRPSKRRRVAATP